MRDLQHDSGGYKRELELLRNTSDKQKEQLQQLQELLILREQEHRFLKIFEALFKHYLSSLFLSI